MYFSMSAQERLLSTSWEMNPAFVAIKNSYLFRFFSLIKQFKAALTTFSDFPYLKFEHVSITLMAFDYKAVTKASNIIKSSSLVGWPFIVPIPREDRQGADVWLAGSMICFQFVEWVYQFLRSFWVSLRLQNPGSLSFCLQYQGSLSYSF